MVAGVVLRGVSPEQMAQAIRPTAINYSLDASGLQLFNATISSVQASLENHQLPGKGSPIHNTLREYALAGGEIPDEWRPAILG
jgi:hypothetical protein